MKDIKNELWQGESIVKTALLDNYMVKKDNLLYNNLCLNCNKNCSTCIGFQFSCLIDSVIERHENLLHSLRIDLPMYKKSRDDFEMLKKKYNGTEVKKEEIELIQSSGYEKIMYERFSESSLADFENDICKIILNNKQSGRSEIDGLKVSSEYINYINNELIAEDVFGYKLIGIIPCFCGLYAVVTNDDNCMNGRVWYKIRSAVFHNERVVFNEFTCFESKFCEIDFRSTAVFYEYQVNMVKSKNAFSLKDYLH